MSDFKFLGTTSDTVYLYDGSLAGFYCCVHTCVYENELPHLILPEYASQGSLFFTKHIETDMPKATRVRNAIQFKISSRALELCEHVFLTPLDTKELLLLHFLLLGFEIHGRITTLLTDPTVSTLLKAEKHLLNEAHLLSGFIRFADHQGKLIATITPKNEVLTLLAPHFADRYANETFLIYDKTHQTALVYHEHKCELAHLQSPLSFAPDTHESYYQSLWQHYYDTIAITERYNPRCRMSHMPKRYWENMTEMQPHAQITTSIKSY